MNIDDFCKSLIQYYEDDEQGDGCFNLIDLNKFINTMKQQNQERKKLTTNYKSYKDNIPALIDMCDNNDLEYNDWLKFISACFKEGHKQGDPELYWDNVLLWDMKNKTKHDNKSLKTHWRNFYK